MNEMIQFLEELTLNLVKNLVDAPNEVKVTTTTTTKNIILQVYTAKDDRGKLIGRKGRTIDALKVILNAVKNTKYKNDDFRKIVLEILE
ncbi:MAG: UPF0109 protein [Candidatus Woesearchaeota archaeon]|nr:MAG: UPF0109 protein [Candidatus Woesearchaeota archaeon]